MAETYIASISPQYHPMTEAQFEDYIYNKVDKQYLLPETINMLDRGLVSAKVALRAVTRMRKSLVSEPLKRLEGDCITFENKITDQERMSELHQKMGNNLRKRHPVLGERDNMRGLLTCMLQTAQQDMKSLGRQDEALHEMMRKLCDWHLAHPEKTKEEQADPKPKEEPALKPKNKPTVMQPDSNQTESTGLVEENDTRAAKKKKRKKKSRANKINFELQEEDKEEIINVENQEEDEEEKKKNISFIIDEEDKPAFIVQIQLLRAGSMAEETTQPPARGDTSDKAAAQPGVQAKTDDKTHLPTQSSDKNKTQAVTQTKPKGKAQLEAQTNSKDKLEPSKTQTKGKGKSQSEGQENAKGKTEPNGQAKTKKKDKAKPETRTEGSGTAKSAAQAKTEKPCDGNHEPSDGADAVVETSTSKLLKPEDIRFLKELHAVTAEQDEEVMFRLMVRAVGEDVDKDELMKAVRHEYETGPQYTTRKEAHMAEVFWTYGKQHDLRGGTYPKPFQNYMLS